jgi:hypothetical protein
MIDLRFWPTPKREKGHDQMLHHRLLQPFASNESMNAPFTSLSLIPTPASQLEF